jgi:sporulation protein YlmC with PRC-barrel domain
MFAAEQATQRDQSRTTQQTPPSQQPTMPSVPGAQLMSGTLHRTDKLLGADVKNAQGEDLGKIYDLVLTPDHQQISYAALSTGVTLGVGAKYYAIPWSAFQVGPQGNLTASISKSQLDQASGFSRNNWPAQPDWQLTSATGQGRTFGQPSSMGTQPQSSDVTTDRSAADTRQTTRPGQSFDRTQRSTADESQATESQTARTGRQRPGTFGTYGTEQAPGMGATAGSAAMNADIQSRRITHLTGMKVMNPDGEDIGNIEGFVIDTRQGQVAYTIVSFGGFWGIGEKYAAVPASAVDLQPRRNAARLDADRETLEKVAFDSGNFPDLSNRQYAQNLHETFNAEPYWSVLGFVSPEQEQAASQRVWGAESPFATQFDASNVKTIQGTVQSVGAFQPEGAAPGTAAGLRIRLTTDDGKLVTVYGGPLSYADQHDFYVMPGDKISVTASETKIGWRDVLVASQIKAGDRTLQLRNEQGQPLWLSEQQQSLRPRLGTQRETTPGMGTRPGAGQRPGQRQPENP